MASPRSAEAKVFYRAARERLGDARTLLDNDRTTGAVYLAGYGVESILKALLLERTPKSRRAEVLESFRGQLGHNFDWLKHELRRTGFTELRRSSQWFLEVADWSTELRYVAKQKRHQDAEKFVQAAEGIVNWGEQHF